MIGWLKKLFKPKLEHTCSVFCPGCHQDLTRSDAECFDCADGLVGYRCACGVQSFWDFDPPVPVFVSSTLGMVSR
jgi:hypothetical protein